MLVLLIVCLGAAIVVPKVREGSRRLACGNHLRQLCTCSAIDSEWPFDDPEEDLQAFLEQARCPSGGGSYVFHIPFASRSESRNVDPSMVLAYEALSNHGGAGGNTLFADGHSEFVQGDRYLQLVAGLGPVSRPPLAPR
ncbi:MAG: hypothetical protein IID37_17140 [Planctomycetes bacterium]|nr:hypothetical protein [Planctomycetota bacterium]